MSALTRDAGVDGALVFVIAIFLALRASASHVSVAGHAARVSVTGRAARVSVAIAGHATGGVTVTGVVDLVFVEPENGPATPQEKARGTEQGQIFQASQSGPEGSTHRSRPKYLLSFPWDDRGFLRASFSAQAVRRRISGTWPSLARGGVSVGAKSRTPWRERIQFPARFFSNSSMASSTSLASGYSFFTMRRTASASAQSPVLWTATA